MQTIWQGRRPTSRSGPSQPTPDAGAFWNFLPDTSLWEFVGAAEQGLGPRSSLPARQSAERRRAKGGGLSMARIFAALSAVASVFLVAGAGARW